MSEVAKKLSRKIRGVPEARLLTGDEPFFADLKNVETKIRYYGKSIDEAFPITCPSCKTKISKEDAKDLVERHGVSSKALLVNTKGKQNQQLRELYDRIRKGKITSEEAFETQGRIQSMYRDRFSYPSEEQPINSVSGRVPLKCEKCDYLLGSIDVTITAEPEQPIPPDVNAWVALKKTPKEERLIQEYLLPKRHGHVVSYDGWLVGKETMPFIEKLEGYKTELETMPLIRELQREISNIFSSINIAIQKIKDEVQTRPSRVFNLLKNPPQTPSQKIEED